MLAKVLFLISGMLWAIEMIPQLRKIYKRKSVEDISIFFPILCITSMIFYFVASYLTRNWILIISMASPFVCNTAFLIQVIIYRPKFTRTSSPYWECNNCGKIYHIQLYPQITCKHCGEGKIIYKGKK